MKAMHFFTELQSYIFFYKVSHENDLVLNKGKFFVKPIVHLISWEMIGSTGYHLKFFIHHLCPFSFKRHLYLPHTFEMGLCDTKANTYCQYLKLQTPPMVFD